MSECLIFSHQHRIDRDAPCSSCERDEALTEIMGLQNEYNEVVHKNIDLNREIERLTAEVSVLRDGLEDIARQRPETYASDTANNALAAVSGSQKSTG